MHPSVLNAAGKLIRAIGSYESDTFSAEELDLQHQETCKMAANIINELAEQLNESIQRTPLHMDGKFLFNKLLEVRDPSTVRHD